MIPFNNLLSAYEEHAGEIESAVLRVLRSGWYILGPELEAFEAAFARYHDVAHAVGVASGTDAIELALRAAGIGPGDEVITVALTAVAEAVAIERAGAVPVFVDIDQETYTMDPQAAEAAITPRTKCLLPVHLYGHPADLSALREIAERHDLFLLEDCAQAHGAKYDGQLVGTFGDAAIFSFYPTKNLGAYGDAGAVITNDEALADRLKVLRNYGQETRYNSSVRGINSRLDEVQAAILSIRLRHLDKYNAARREIAHQYNELLQGVDRLHLPVERENAHHVYHLYVVRHPERDALMQRLDAAGVQTLIHYPYPIHLQSAYKDLGDEVGSLPVTERSAREILSLPLYVGIGSQTIEQVAAALRESVQKV